MMRLSVCARIARILFSIADCTILKVAKSRTPLCFSTVFILARLMRACAKVARQEGVAEDGYRVVANIGVNGAQTVQHLHLHVMGGIKLSEQMA